jgi:hypothetical protein
MIIPNNVEFRENRYWTTCVLLLMPGLHMYKLRELVEFPAKRQDGF